MPNRVTTKGQVTIPKDVRDMLGVAPGDEVEFVESHGQIRIKKKKDYRASLEAWAGVLADGSGIATDELIEEMRGR